MIYNFCYSIPLTSSRYGWIAVAESEPKPASQLIYRRDDGTVMELRKIAAKCQYPKCHLSLLSFCGQIRNEYFPTFAARHTFSLNDPLIFAIECLSYNPPYRYSDIRHLALTWNLPDRKCRCEVVVDCRVHGLREPDVIRDMRNFIKLVNVYPELFRGVKSLPPGSL